MQKLIEEALKKAFGRATNATRKQQASMLDTLRRVRKIPANSGAFVAARWLLTAENADAIVEKAIAGLKNPRLDVRRSAIEALHWLSADPETGRGGFSDHKSSVYPVPDWMKQSPELAEALLFQMRSQHSKESRMAEAFIRRRDLASHWAEVAPSNEPLRRAVEKEAIIALRALPNSRPAEVDLASRILEKIPSGRLDTTDFSFLLDSIRVMSPEENPDAIERALKRIAQTDKRDIEGDRGSRDHLIGHVRKLFLRSDKDLHQRAGALALRSLAPSMRAKDTRGLLEELGAIAKNVSGQHAAETAKAASEALEATPKPKDFGKAPEEKRSKKKRALIQILGDLLSDSLSTQKAAAAELSSWSPAENHGKTPLTDALNKWQKKGGPDFDKILADLLDGKYGEDMSLKKAVLGGLLELTRTPRSKGGFEEGIQKASQMQRALAEHLTHPDPEVRSLASQIASRRRVGSDGDDFERILLAGLKDPQKRKYVMDFLESASPFRGRGYVVPAWLEDSEAIQKELINLVAKSSKDARTQPAHTLLARLHKARRKLSPTEERKLGESAPVRQARLESLLPDIEKLVTHGDPTGKAVGLSYLREMGLKSRQVPELLAAVAETDPDDSVRAEAMRALGYREFNEDFERRMMDGDAILGRVWDRFANDPNPDVRHEAAGVILANTEYIHSLPSHRKQTPNQPYVETGAGKIKKGLQGLNKSGDGSNKYPVPEEQYKQLVQALDEITRGRNFHTALESFEASEQSRVTSESELESLRAFVDQCYERK